MLLQGEYKELDYHNNLRKLKVEAAIYSSRNPFVVELT